MPTVAEILAGIDSFVTPAKRRVVDMLMNPRAAMAQTAGRLSDDSNAALRDLNTQADANMLRAQGSVMADLPQYRQAEDASRQRIVNMLMNFAPVGATVWHGSPHKFDKFDASKIGTGEGNQSYGHGLYAADSPKTVLSPQTNYMQNERIYKRNSGGLNPFQEYISDLMDQGLKKEEAFGRMTGEGRKVAQMTKLQPGEAPFDAFSREWENVNGMNTGNLYKVDLPDEAIAKMLDWDKPLSQQSPEVKAFAEKVLAPQIKASQSVVDGWGNLSSPYNLMDEMTGSQFLQHLRDGKATVENIIGGGGPAVSGALRQAGIPGIRYLDGGSRSAGQGTSNYVVFPGNENLLQILERNGKPIK